MLLLLCSNPNQQLWQVTSLTMSELVLYDEHVFGRKRAFIPSSLKHHECDLGYIYFALYGRGAPWSRKWLGTMWSINLEENILIDGGFSFWLGVLLKSSNLTHWEFINLASNRICQNGKVFAWIIESYDAVKNLFIPSFLSLFKQTLNLK